MRKIGQALTAAALTALLASTAAAETYGAARAAPGAVAEQDVRVQRNGAGFSIDVSMLAPVPLDIAWAVLTDFEHMPRYQTQLKSSDVLERSPTRLLVRQQGVARLGPFSSAFESVRELTLTPSNAIRARQVSGAPVKQMSSLMQLEREPAGTRLRYHADVEPDTALPPLFGPAFVQHESAEQFSAMIREMQRRQQARTAQ